jgi:TolB-like protein/class 3 adenylate cyclase/Flp pilus assembly protein TadD
MSAELNPDLQLEIAYLLLIDVVGYSKLLVNDQIELLHELNRLVRSTASFQAAESNNKLIRVPTGDGMALIFFRSPEEPARCAIEISEALKTHPDIQLRMGVHSGPINQVTDVNDRVNVAGTGINVAQRVMDCADAGHILLTKHVADDLAQYRHWQPYLHDLGEYEVKHGLRVHIVNLYKDGLGNPALPEKLKRRARWKQRGTATVKPVRAPAWPKTLLLIALVLSALALATSFFILFRRGVLSRTSNAAIIPEKSIAVLPFENRSEEKANAYLTDGIQDEILTRLSKIADLKVISRTSTQHYKSTPENLPAIARELGVAHILEGSVQKSGGSIRVNVQLIKAASDSHIWADTFDRKLTDIFLVESDISRAIADQLRVRLTGREQQIIVDKPTENSEAYNAYLRGLVYNIKSLDTAANTLGAQKYLREAVRLDPKFASAWALLSYVDSLGYISLNLQPTAELREEALHAANTALALQSNLGEAVLAKGYYHYACLKDYDSAVRYFEQARSLLPNSSEIPVSLAYVARRQGQWDRCEAFFNEAEALDPRNTTVLSQHALFYSANRRFGEALRKLDQVLEIAPDDVGAPALKAAIAQAQGDLPRASALLTPLRPGADDANALETQAYQAILEGRPAQAIPRLTEVLTTPNPTLGYVNGELRFWLGWAQDLAGHHAVARTTWEQARQELETFLKEQEDNYALIGDLALVHMGLGEKQTAFVLVDRAMAANPMEKDAIAGPGPVEIQARVAAQLGDPDRAFAALEKLIGRPYTSSMASQGVPITSALLRLDPMFAPLRTDPRFQQLLASGRAN